MGLTIVIGLISIVIVVGARFMPLDRAPAVAAIVVWLCTLFVGAATTFAGAAFALAYLPQTGIYGAIAGFCVHAAIPVVSTHLLFSGHVVLHVATIIPLTMLALSALWLAVRVAMGWWKLRLRLLDAGTSKDGCSVIQDDEIVMGVTPIGRGRIVISDATVRSMDAQEFEASLSHELGHLRRGHRPILLVSRVLAALSFPFPGNRQARDRLLQALERDADEYAVRQTRDPLALASAICKAATGSGLVGEMRLAGGLLSRRLDYLEGDVRPIEASQRHAIQALCALFVVGTVLFTVTLTIWSLGLPLGGHSWLPNGLIC